MNDQNFSLKWVSGDKTPWKVYITRVLNYGTWEEWGYIKTKFGLEKIREAVEKPLRGQWTKRGKRFAEVIFICRISDDVLKEDEV